MAKKCPKHNNKAIFNIEEMAHNYMKTFHPYRAYQVYPCPTSEAHFHIRDRIKRNKSKRSHYESL